MFRIIFGSSLNPQARTLRCHLQAAAHESNKVKLAANLLFAPSIVAHLVYQNQWQYRLRNELRAAYGFINVLARALKPFGPDEEEKKLQDSLRKKRKSRNAHWWT